MFEHLSKVNKITKLISIENAEYGAASDSSRNGQKFFCKKLNIILQSHVRFIKVFVYQIVANFILYKNKY